MEKKRLKLKIKPAIISGLIYQMTFSDNQLDFEAVIYIPIYAI